MFNLLALAGLELVRLVLGLLGLVACSGLVYFALPCFLALLCLLALLCYAIRGLTWLISLWPGLFR